MGTFISGECKIIVLVIDKLGYIAAERQCRDTCWDNYRNLRWAYRHGDGICFGTGCRASRSSGFCVGTCGAGG